MATGHKERTENMGQSATGFMDQAKETASNVAAEAGNRAKDAASFVGQKAEDATGAVGSGMKSLAGTIREHTPASGPIGSASCAVADTLESSGRYLQEHGLSGIGADMTSLIRRNPIPALLVGIGVGFLISRATTTRS